MSEGSNEEETRFDRCPPYGDEYTGCTCGLLQLLGFHNRIGRTIKTGSYVRLNSTDRRRNSSKKCKDHEISDSSVTKKDNKFILFQKKEKEKSLRSTSYKRNIKAWIKKRINRKSNKSQKMIKGNCSNSPRVSFTKCNSKSNYFEPNENIDEIGRTLLDGILHKIPYGEKVPEGIINGNKLLRSLSENYESYHNKYKEENEKYKRNFSTPALIYESKIINGEKEEEKKEKKNEINEDINEDNNGIVLIEDGEVLVSEQEGFIGDFLVELDLETEIEIDLENQIEEKSEIDTESETETEEISETDLESEIEENSEMSLETKFEIEEESELEEMDLKFGLKSMSFNAKEIEFVPNLLRKLGLDLDTINQAQIELKYQKFPILNSYKNLQQFTEIWDQINEIEFSKFDCDFISQDIILLLDLIDQIYKETYTNPSSNIHWFLNYKSKLDSENLENAVLKEVREKVTWHLSDERESSEEADDIIENWDFVKIDNWFDFRNEIEDLVDEFERFVLDDLIDDFLLHPIR